MIFTAASCGAKPFKATETTWSPGVKAGKYTSPEDVVSAERLQFR